MSRPQIQQAQQLIKQGRHDEARRILERMDTPQARSLLAKLDRKPRRRGGSGAGSIIGGLLTYLLAIVISLLLTSGLLAGLVIMTAPERDGTLPRTTQAATSVAAENGATDTPAPPARTGVVTSSQSINVRSGPSTGTDAIASLMPGTQVEVVGESDSGEWYQVRLPNGREGWVSSNLMDADPAPTTVAQGTTAEPESEATATPAETCTPGEAQTWYDANRLTIDRIYYTMMQAEGRANVDYESLSAMVRENRQAFEEAEAPACVEEARRVLLVGFQAVDNSYQNRILGFPNDAVAEMNIANQQFQQANDLLASQFEVRTSLTECGAEVWYAGIEEDVTEYFSTIDGIAIDTAPSNEIRTAIFSLQELRNRINVTHPPCAAAAHNHLQNSVGAAVRLFQAIMANDTPANKQTHLAAMVNEATGFLNEMRDLGVRIT